MPGDQKVWRETVEHKSLTDAPLFVTAVLAEVPVPAVLGSTFRLLTAKVIRSDVKINSGRIFRPFKTTGDVPAWKLKFAQDIPTIKTYERGS